MAELRDADGTIVINEIEAQADIKNVSDARAKLLEAMRLLNPAKLDESRMSGKAKDALADQLQRIYKNMENLGLNCEKTSTFIEQTVAKYRQIDSDLAKTLNGG
ncbi:MAG: hypothetical protein LBF92_00965 [Synergistaceae bacterium]|jgi:hypothetical protein|nr:hypothetical protein [Synergistaceae bacterium]